MLLQLALGFVLAAIVSYTAYRLHSLTAGGAVAATLLGTIVFGLGGLQWAILLLAFFVPSSALTRAFGRAKREVEGNYDKSGARDPMQVFSNGGVAGALVLLHALFPGSVWPWIGFAGALAAVNADTWATELGILNPSKPRLITSFRQVEKGTSGAISAVGTAAALLAAAFIGGLAALFVPGNRVLVLTIVAAAGLAGSLVDSLLGATLQALYYCPLDRKETEKHPLHTCGTETTHIRGWSWLNNDLVNLLCGLTGAALAMLIGVWLAAA